MEWWASIDTWQGTIFTSPSQPFTMLLLRKLYTYLHCYHSALSNDLVVKINSWDSPVIISNAESVLTLVTAHGRQKAMRAKSAENMV
jgi:hypothetical protein